MAGVFGNISYDDIHRTIEGAAPAPRAPGDVIWTRSRRAPDLTPAVPRWLSAAGLVLQAFHAPDDVRFPVGVQRFVGVPRPAPYGKLFDFVV